MKPEELDQKRWGVCGFVAALQAYACNVGMKFYDSEKNARYDIKNANYDILFPVIDNFVSKHPELHAELQEFSEVFSTKGIKYTGTTTEMVKAMRKDKSMSGEKEAPKEGIGSGEKEASKEGIGSGEEEAPKEGIGLATSAKCITTLCQDLGFKDANFIGETTSVEFKYSNCIYGISIKEKLTNGIPLNYRYGLHHWIYVDTNKKPMTWGGYKSMEKINHVAKKITHRINLGEITKNRKLDGHDSLTGELLGKIVQAS